MIPPSCLTPEALADLEEATLYYEESRPGLGETFSAEVFRLIQRIVDSPRQFPVIERTMRRGVLHRFPYSIYFLFDSGEVVILAILHHRRDPAIWKGRLDSVR